MKDLLKRLLCIVLALTMVVALVACGSSEDEDEEEDEETVEEGKKSSKKNKKETEEETEEEEDSLVGKWEGTLDISDYISDMMYAEMGVEMDVEDFAIVMTIKFNEDGTYKAELDTSPMEKAMGGFIDDLWDIVMEMAAEEAGMSVSEVEKMMEEQGVTKDALMEEMDLEAAMEEAFAEFTEESKGEWILDGDELYMASEDPEDSDPVIIEFDGDEFSIVDGAFADMDDDMLEYILPIVFERV